MKKILLSLVFLLLISVSSNAMADACVGSLNCAGKSNSDCTAANSACTWAASSSTCSNTSSKSCSDLGSRTACLAGGCVWSTTGDPNSNAFVTTMCNALKIVTGNGGKAFAAFAIISVGIGFFTGKISWGLMIGVTAGIAAMFGAPTIVAAIAGGSALDCGS